MLVAEGLEGHTLPVNFHRVPPFCRAGLSRFSWPLAFRVLLSSLLPSPSPVPESAPRGCHVHFCLYPYLNFALS